MKQLRIVSVFLAVCILCGNFCSGFAAATAGASPSIKSALAETGTYLQKTAVHPEVGSIGGEWAVLGLARSDCSVPTSWYSDYYQTLISYVQQKNGVLSSTKYTEYARVVLALTAIGKDPSDVGGYNMLQSLSDYQKVTAQGVNGVSYALIALDSGNYPIPAPAEGTVKATRQLLIQKLKSQQLPAGGFSLDGTTADPDVTAMALQALSPYQNQSDVKNMVQKAVLSLSNVQNKNGGYESSRTEDAESAAQVVVALTALGIDPGSDSRFIKNGSSVLDNLMTFYVPGGGFRHIEGDKIPNGMATEQGFYALVAYERFLNGKNALYDMSDATDRTAGQNSGSQGLPNKNQDVKKLPVLYPGKTFEDISGDSFQKAIEALAARGIINGVGSSVFQPNRTMTRAEFAAVMVRALGLVPSGSSGFSDVPKASWYAPYVGTASAYQIVNGISKTAFSPNQTITREQAAVMVMRAARLCGLETDMTDAETLDLLAQFPDYTKSALWARNALAFCYQNDILSQSMLLIQPQKDVTRSEIAGMADQMLQKARLV
ncbi:MAG: S-layer homology domain-containing protein [Oscillospiraceae bacterium]|nr:S-layer homology domain-containing protein [Oscillospiraceae bacterium]